MILGCLTVYAIAFSCCVLVVGKSYATAPVQVDVTTRHNDRRGSKLQFNNSSSSSSGNNSSNNSGNNNNGNNNSNNLKTNSSLDAISTTKTGEKSSKSTKESKVFQSSYLPSNPVKFENLSKDSIQILNESHSYFAFFDPILNATKKLIASGPELPPFISGNVLSNYIESKEVKSDGEKKRRSQKRVNTWDETSKREIIQNFVTWDTLEDSEKEIRVHYNRITAKETIITTGVDEETGKKQGLKLRQLTDGIHFIQLIYTFDNQIQDCEYLRQKAVIRKFLNQFKEDVNRAKETYDLKTSEKKNGKENEADEDYEEEDEGKIERYSSDSDEVYETETNFGEKYRNVTFQIIRNDENLPEELLEWMNFRELKKKCKENHRILKALAYDSRHGNEKTKNLAEEHIQRKKRDIMDVFLVPGTKWCGKGRRATKYTSLGGFSRTDKCCRVHDTMCPHWIGGMEEKYGLFNWRINTIMHCRCDQRFRACLKMARTGTANFVGKLFFNVVQTKCFVLKPKEVCLKYSWWGTCEKTEYRKQAYLRDNFSY